MLAPFSWMLLISPALLVEHSIDRTLFPKGAEKWDRIGLFRLKDGDQYRSVLLYYYDSDSVAAKARAKGGVAIQTYPNFFDVHAIYQVAPGKWVHQEVFGFARGGFSKVANVAPDFLVLECRPKVMVHLEAGEDVGRVAGEERAILQALDAEECARRVPDGRSALQGVHG